MPWSARCHGRQTNPAVQGNLRDLHKGFSDVVVHGGKAQIATVHREGGVRGMPACLPPIDQGGFFAAHVGAGAQVQFNVKRKFRPADVAAQLTGLSALCQNLQQMGAMNSYSPRRYRKPLLCPQW